MIKCIIVDDEPLACELLAGYINRTPELQLAKPAPMLLKLLTSLIKKILILFFLTYKCLP